MDGDSNIAAIGSLLANPGRCRILFALADGRALPASRLAIEAEQRPHLSGALGATLLERLFEHGWLRHSPSSRATHPTEEGRAGLKSRFGLKRDESDGAVVTFEQRRWSPVKGGTSNRRVRLSIDRAEVVEEAAQVDCAGNVHRS